MGTRSDRYRKKVFSRLNKKNSNSSFHDSFIAPAELEETLRQVMIEAYQEIIGKEFLPAVKK